MSHSSIPIITEQVHWFIPDYLMNRIDADVRKDVMDNIYFILIINNNEIYGNILEQLNFFRWNKNNL